MLRACLALLIALFALASCNAPGPDFRGVPSTRLTVAGTTFDVRVAGARAEAIRLNSEWPSNLGHVPPRGVAAIEAVSGCRVRRLRGDVAVMTARLDCGQPLRPLPRQRIYECDLFPVTDDIAELTCREEAY